MNSNIAEINKEFLAWVSTLEQIIPNFRFTNEVLKTLDKLCKTAQGKRGLELVYDELDIMDNRYLVLEWS